MKALKVQVERVVRPIRASNLRKDRMREELLAHLTRLFDEELARKGDAQSATAEAIRRFGDAAALSRELQASVSWLERWAFYSFPYSGRIRRRPGESPLGYILRTNLWGIAVPIPFYAWAVLMSTIAKIQHPHRADMPAISQVLLFLMVVAAIQFAGMIGLGLLSEGIRQELESRAAAGTAVERRRASWRIVGYTVTSAAVLGAAVAGMLILILIGLPIPVPFITSAQFWRVTAVAVVLGLPLTLLHAWSWKARTRRFENWDTLDLDEQRVA